MLDKKQIWAIFLFEFKVNHKAAETTCNINNAFSPGTGDECAAQGWFKKLCKGDKSLENEKCSGRPPGVDNDQFWKPSLKLILLQLHKQLPKNSALTILWSFSIWSKLEGWKSSVRGCLMSRPKIKKKNPHFEVSSSLILCNSEPLLDQSVTCNKKWILCDNWWQPTQWRKRK